MVSESGVENDLVIIEKILAGEENAFEELVSKYQRPLIYFIRRFLDADEAEDVVQSTWLKVYLNLKSLRARSRFRTWLYQIARNMMISHIRKHGRQVLEENFDDFQDPKQDITIEMIRIHEAQQVHEALNRIKPVFREVLTLLFMEDMSYEEMAQVCSCSIGTIKSRVFYAKQAMMSELEGKL